MFVNSQLNVGQLFFSSIKSNLFCQHTVNIKYFSTRELQPVAGITVTQKINDHFL